MPTVFLLDYVAGNVRSLVNAIEKLGWTVEWIQKPEDVAKADVSQTLHIHSQIPIQGSVMLSLRVIKLI